LHFLAKKSKVAAKKSQNLNTPDANPGSSALKAVTLLPEPTNFQTQCCKFSI